MKRLAAAFLLVFIVGCAGIIPEAKTPRERLVVLEYTYQGALKTIDNLSRVGLITRVDVPKINGLILQASDAVAAARLAVRLKQSTVMTTINIATSILLQLTTYLETKKGKTSWLIPSLLYKPYLRYFKPLVRPAKQWGKSVQSLKLPTLKVGIYRMKSLNISPRSQIASVTRF